MISHVWLELLRQTHQPAHDGDVVGRAPLAVLEAWLSTFLKQHTSRLDPSYAARLRKSGGRVRAVSDARKRLREVGLLRRIRCCVEGLTAHSGEIGR